jgi:LysR family transcriptional activator of nhaA
MEWLNYHHLLYFWMVAKEGTVARAAKHLHLAQPTVSGQVRALENALGEKLFAKKGRHLELTEVGQVTFAYADDIFRLGRELLGTVKGRPTGKPIRLRVGVSEVVPKLVAYRILEPALRLGQPVQLVVDEDRTDRLLARLATHELDVVLSDQPLPPGRILRAYNHLLGESGVSFFAAAKLRAKLKGPFPGCLDSQPLLVPLEGSFLRTALDRYLTKHGITPTIVGEFEDSALLKVFGERGEGVFAGPTVIEREIKKHYAVTCVGRAPEIRERFYVHTVERRLSHAAVIAICETARTKLFPEGKDSD